MDKGQYDGQSSTMMGLPVGQGVLEIIGAAYGKCEVTSKVHHIYHVLKNKVISAKNEVFGDSWVGI